MRREGAHFLAWLSDNAILAEKFSTCATVLSESMLSAISTAEDARRVWDGVPRALSHCDPETMHEDWGVVLAYAWLHFLERYVRTWKALEHLVHECCLPMASKGVRALDVGSGLGPTAFAIHDFYSTMVEFANATGRPLWRQPVEVTCIENGHGFNDARHHLAEMMCLQSQLPSVLSICSNLGDFKRFRPREERKERFRYLRSAEEEFFDDLRGQWTAEPLYTAAEASYMAQALHRYRLFSFANFFTTNDEVLEFKENLKDSFRDASPGSVLLMMGGKENNYPQIYSRLQQLAVGAGFRQVASTRVSSSDSEVADRVYEAGQQLYRHLQDLAPNEDDSTKAVRRYFEGEGCSPSSNLLAFRKYRSR